MIRRSAEDIMEIEYSDTDLEKHGIEPVMGAVDYDEMIDIIKKILLIEGLVDRDVEIYVVEDSYITEREKMDPFWNIFTFAFEFDGNIKGIAFFTVEYFEYVGYDDLPSGDGYIGDVTIRLPREELRKSETKRHYWRRI